MTDIVERLKAVDHLSVEDCFTQSPLFSQAAEEITRLRQLISEAEKRENEVRAAALEEAARVATGWKCALRPGNIQRLYGHQDAAEAIARAILALRSEHQ